jgi:putative endonuclease
MMYYVYILATGRDATFYVGFTNDLVRRVYEHKQGIVKGFTSKHNVYMLVYYEVHEDVNEAIKREKLIKKWRRAIKYQAIFRQNPDWIDLYQTIL